MFDMLLTWCFRYLNVIHPHSGNPGRVSQTPARASAAPLLVHHMEALSAASLVVLTSFLCAASTMPSRMYALHREGPTQQCVLSGSFLQLPLWHWVGSSYLGLFCSIRSSMQFSQRTFSSIKSTCFKETRQPQQGCLDVVWEFELLLQVYVQLPSPIQRGAPDLSCDTASSL